MGEALVFEVGRKRTEIVFGDYALAEGPGRLHVFDEHTAALHAPLPVPFVVVPPGEGSKTWQGVEIILRRAFADGLARDSVFIGVGGGMVCDLASFAASVFMRGARLELVPTSLLAMVDASFGGKTAVNFEGYKNMVGTFFPAEKVYISAAPLKNLPAREFLGGLAEVVKAAMLGDPELFELLEKLYLPAEGADPSVPGTGEGILDLVKRALLVKARFVAEDPTEQGVRAYLNLGHTFGHGLEAATGFGRFTHGEAVAWGIFRALDAGLSLGTTDSDYSLRVKRLLRSCGFGETVSGIDARDILAAMGRDKKKRSGKVHFVLQRTLGETYSAILEEDFVLRCLKAGLS